MLPGWLCGQLAGGDPGWAKQPCIFVYDERDAIDAQVAGLDVGLFVQGTDADRS